LSHAWAPIGHFGWREREDYENHISKEIEAEISTIGNDWPPLKAGLFDASADRVRSVKSFLDERVNKLGWGWQTLRAGHMTVLEGECWYDLGAFA
jgi:hypothetical protein